MSSQSLIGGRYTFSIIAATMISELLDTRNVNSGFRPQICVLARSATIALSEEVSGHFATTMERKRWHPLHVKTQQQRQIKNYGMDTKP